MNSEEKEKALSVTIFFVCMAGAFLLGGYAPIFVEEISGHCNNLTEGEFTKSFTQLDDEGMSRSIGYWESKGWNVTSDWARMEITVRCGGGHA